MKHVVLNGMVYRLARTKQDDLWEKVSEVCSNLQEVSASEAEHNNKKESSRDHILALKGLFQELGLW